MIQPSSDYLIAQVHYALISAYYSDISPEKHSSAHGLKAHDISQQTCCKGLRGPDISPGKHSWPMH